MWIIYSLLARMLNVTVKILGNWQSVSHEHSLIGLFHYFNRYFVSTCYVPACARHWGDRWKMQTVPRFPGAHHPRSGHYSSHVTGRRRDRHWDCGAQEYSLSNLRPRSNWPQSNLHSALTIGMVTLRCPKQCPNKDLSGKSLPSESETFSPLF